MFEIGRSTNFRASRRGMLRSAGTLAVLTALPLPMLPRQARAEVMTALAIANASVGILRAFAGSSDGGLGATLRAQGQKLDVISAQVAQVQEELGKLAVAVGQLPATFQEIVRSQFVVERIYQVQACAAEWREITSRSSFRREGELVPTDAADLDEVRKKARNARFLLSSTDVGEQPLAASIGMFALALDVSLESRLRGSTAGLKESLGTYVDWFKRVMNPTRPTSAAATHKALKGQVADEVREIFAMPPLSETALDASLVGDARPASWSFASSVAACYREYSPEVNIPGRYCSFCNGEIGGHYRPARFGHSPTVHVAWEVGYVVQDGVRTWHVRSATVPQRANTPASGWTPAHGLVACTPQNAEVPFSPSLDQAKQVALRLPVITTAEQRIVTLAAQIAALNVLEARVVFAARSLDIADSALRQAQAWLAELG